MRTTSMRGRWLAASVAVLVLAGAGCKKDPPPETESAGETGEPSEEPGQEPAPEPVAPKPAAKASAPAAAPAVATPGVATPANGTPAAEATPSVAPTPPPAALPPSPPARPLPDLRLLLTQNDAATFGGKVDFRRTMLPGLQINDDQDALYYEPVRGGDFGLGIQVFRSRDMDGVRERFNGMLASYPSAQEIAPIAGKTFFAYWDEVLFVGFIQPNKSMVVVLSCGRKFCDSDGLYELAKKVSARAN